MLARTHGQPPYLTYKVAPHRIWARGVAIETSSQAKIARLKERAARRETTRYSAAFRTEAVALVTELRQKNWTQQRISKELGIPWVTLKRWASNSARAPRESGGFRAVHVVDSPDLPRSPVLISPSGWRIEGLSVGELVELAGRL